MNAKQILIAAAFAALAPLAAHAESPNAIVFDDSAPSTRTYAQSQAEVLALNATERRNGEIYPFAITEPSKADGEQTRALVLALQSMHRLVNGEIGNVL